MPSPRAAPTGAVAPIGQNRPRVYLESREPALPSMTNTAEADPIELLVPEVERYLSIVQYFRTQGCEPHWSGETTAAAQTGPAEAASPRLPD
jgi:hypothetical protein